MIKNYREQKLENLPDVLTVEEVAKIFRIAKITVKRWLARGRINGIKINERGDWRFLKSHIEKALEYYG